MRSNLVETHAIVPGEQTGVLVLPEVHHKNDGTGIVRARSLEEILIIVSKQDFPLEISVGKLSNDLNFK